MDAGAGYYLLHRFFAEALFQFLVGDVFRAESVIYREDSGWHRLVQRGAAGIQNVLNRAGCR